MGVTLDQNQTASYPDRPTTPGYGMRAVAMAGDGGAFIASHLHEAVDVIHVRVLVNAMHLSGGRAILMLGTDSAGDESFRLALDATHQQIELAAGDESLTCDLVDGLAWHCLEWRIDCLLGEMRLWRNGIEVATAVASHLLPTQQVHAGLVMKDVAMLGELWIDEWVMADEYIGIVRVDPIADHAADPRRWLIVYNTNDADSVAWAEVYRASRGVPIANMCGLAMPSAEAISVGACEALVDAIEQYVTANGLADQIMGVLLGHGVPGVYTRSDGVSAPVTDALQRRDGGMAEIVNPLVDAAGVQRPTTNTLDGDWITVRIDGPTLAESIALIDRATVVSSTVPIDPASSGLWIDLASGGGGLVAFENMLRAWAGSIDRQATRLPITTSDDEGLPGDHIAEVHDDGFVWGFVDAQPPTGFFDDAAGSRVLVCPLVDGSATAISLRDAEDGGWTRAALDAGYAAAVGTVRAITPSAFAVAGYFFEALRQGWALGEAWHAASPVLRAGVVLIGDPLMTVSMPQAGWNAYGPFASSADVSWDHPIAMLRDDERSLPLESNVLPEDDEHAIFVVTRVDEAGRELRSFNAVCVEGES